MKNTIIAALAALCLVLGTSLYWQSSGRQKPEATPVRSGFAAFTTEASAADDDIVYFTDKKNKFHRLGCHHIKNKTTQTLTYGQARTQGMEPCKKCYPSY